MPAVARDVDDRRGDIRQGRATLAVPVRLPPAIDVSKARRAARLEGDRAGRGDIVDIDDAGGGEGGAGAVQIAAADAAGTAGQGDGAAVQLGEGHGVGRRHGERVVPVTVPSAAVPAVAATLTVAALTLGRVERGGAAGEAAARIDDAEVAVAAGLEGDIAGGGDGGDVDRAGRGERGAAARGIARR